MVKFQSPISGSQTQHRVNQKCKRYRFQSPISGSQTEKEIVSYFSVLAFQSPISGSQTVPAAEWPDSWLEFQSPISGSQTHDAGPSGQGLYYVSIPYKRVTNDITEATLIVIIFSFNPL